ncbi:HNH endonuclease [Pectobacterium versatile]|uniref:HNH endonuclease signature motif containing protein n=2 Tax=Pectobacterium versatile TaxID=2488639 RepID=A0ABU8K420_9GAMM|nr:HNH endonuclease signature motif containing protein [Pectobacterium versatile]MCA6924799.1 HNH endonuclease [Pectobacterium versatile]MCH5081564.1 HNH endonuclease [Pectobacterium versatile]
MKYFILQANPKIYKVEDYFRDKQYVYWTIKKLHGNKKHHISKGDIVFFWRTVGNREHSLSGFIAKGIVEESPVKRGDILHPECLGDDLWIKGLDTEGSKDKQVGIRILEYRDIDDPNRLSRSNLQHDPILKKLHVVDTGLQGNIATLLDKFSTRIEELWCDNEKGGSHEEINEDIKEIESNVTISETTKKQLINARLGQGDFRNKVLTNYPECPITGVSLPSLLKASHIKPWRISNNKERLDPYNGIMLSPHIDALFDKGYISFADDGSMLIRNDFIIINEIKLLNVPCDIKIEINENSKKYLDWHRKFLFHKNK